MKNLASYDVVVVGAGHAGCEAALAAARLKLKTALVTFTKDKIALLSCNPAVGGLGKGQLVKEIDALGGEIAKAADSAGIQFKKLNASKGPAVWSSRAQVDMNDYPAYMRSVVEKQKNLTVVEGEAIGFIIKAGKIQGLKLNKNRILKTKKVILACGTFLNGLMHIGMESFEGGRIEEPVSAKKISRELAKIGHRILRFKTGTLISKGKDGSAVDKKTLTSIPSLGKG